MFGRGIFVGNEALLTCVDPCPDPAARIAGRIAAAPGARVLFFAGTIPTSQTTGNGAALAIPPGTTHIVAERNAGFWTERSERDHQLVPGGQSLFTPPQRVDVTFGDDGTRFVAHVRLPRSDERASGYVAGGFPLERMLNYMAPLTIDGTQIALLPNLSRAHFMLDGSTLQLDIGGKLPPGLGAMERGEHTIRLGEPSWSPVDVHVHLDGEAFAQTGAFDVAPASLTGLTDAQWRLFRRDAIGLRVERTTSSGVARSFQRFAKAVQSSALLVLTALLGMAWQIAAILATIRLLPRGERASLARAAFALISACVTLGIGVVATVVGVALGGGAHPIVVTCIALIGIGGMYLVANRSERIALGARPAFAIGAIVFIVAGAFQLELAVERGPIGWQLLGSSLLPLVTFAIATATGLIALAPRLLVRAARLPSGASHAAYAALTGVVVLLAAFWRPPLAGDPSHFFLPMPLGDPYEAGLEAVFATVLVGLPLVGILALVCAAGLDPRAPHRMPYRNVVVLLALWCVGIDANVLSLPVPALLALATIPLIALRSRSECAAIAAQNFARAGGADDLFGEAVARSDVETATRTQRQLREKFLSGALGHDEYVKQSDDLAADIAETQKHAGDDHPNGEAPTLFTSYPLAHPIRAARQAAWIGALIFALALVAGFSTMRETAGAQSLSALWLVAWVGHQLARGAVAAFAFVLFLPYLRGNMATTKGIYMAAAIVLAALPAAVLDDSTRLVAANLLVAALFFPVVGVALDVAALARHAGSISLVRLFSFANLGSFAAIGSVVVSAVLSAVTGQLSEAAASFVSGAAHSGALAASTALRDTRR